MNLKINISLPTQLYLEDWLWNVFQEPYHFA